MANDDLIARLKDEATYHEAEYAADLASDHGQIAGLMYQTHQRRAGVWEHRE